MAEPAESAEEREVRESAARREHDAHRAIVTSGLQPVITFGTEALKAAALLNAGSTAAILALISQVFTKDAKFARHLVECLSLFFAGVFIASLATGWAYLAQMWYRRAVREAKLTMQPPFVLATEASDRCNTVANRFRLAAISCVIAAYVAALAGGVWTASGLYRAISRGERIAAISKGATEAPPSVTTLPGSR